MTKFYEAAREIAQVAPILTQIEQLKEKEFPLYAGKGKQVDLSLSRASIEDLNDPHAQLLNNAFADLLELKKKLEKSDTFKNIVKDDDIQALMNAVNEYAGQSMALQTQLRLLGEYIDKINTEIITLFIPCAQQVQNLLITYQQASSSKPSTLFTGENPVTNLLSICSKFLETSNCADFFRCMNAIQSRITFTATTMRRLFTAEPERNLLLGLQKIDFAPSVSPQSEQATPTAASPKKETIFSKLFNK